MGKFEEKIEEDIKRLLDVERVKIVKNLSTVLIYSDEEEFFSNDYDSDHEVLHNTIKTGCSPFERINITCIVYHADGKCSLIEYKAFSIEKDDDIELIKGEVSYLLERMDKHVYEKTGTFGRASKKVRYLDVFMKDNSLYSIFYLDKEYKKRPLEKKFKGEAIADTLNGGQTFYSIQGNAIYKHEIQTGKKDSLGKMCEYIDYLALRTTMLYKDTKEIAKVGFIETRYNDCGEFVTPENILALIRFTDGTNRLLNKKGNRVKSVSNYFDKLVRIKDLEFSDSIVAGRMVFEGTVDGKTSEVVVGNNDGTIKHRAKIFKSAKPIDHDELPF